MSCTFGNCGGVGGTPTTLAPVTPTTLAPVTPTAVAPVAAPSTSAPVSVTVTNKPTPSGSFPYQAEGDSSFGNRYQDDYSLAHQNAYRRPGWSTWEPLTGLGPFCYRNACYNVTDVCDEFGGTLLHDSVCSFPENVKVMGPSCWRGTCQAGGTSVCNGLGGTTVGVADGVNGPQWCIFEGAKSMIGPICYNDACFEDEALSSCTALKGTIWNGNYCVLDGYFTGIGPICWGTSCLSGDAKLTCASDLQGTLFADRWCVVGGCDRTVIGPLCSQAQSNVAAQCFQSEATTLCNTLNGVDIGGVFCVLEGTNWTKVGPTIYSDVESVAATNDYCRQLGGELNDYFNDMVAYSIAGRFCLVQERLPTTTPMCTNAGCDLVAGNKFCSRFNGKVLGQGVMCSLTDSYRSVVGPMMWNGTVLEGNPDYCEGMFCAVPNREEDLDVNLRCPTSAPIVSRGGFLGNVTVGNTSETDGNTTESDGNGTGVNVNGAQGGTSGGSSLRRVSGYVISTVLVLVYAAAW